MKADNLPMPLEKEATIVPIQKAPTADSITTSYTIKHLYTDAPVDRGSRYLHDDKKYHTIVPDRYSILEIAFTCITCREYKLCYSPMTKRIDDKTLYLRNAFAMLCPCGAPVFGERLAGILIALAYQSEDAAARYLALYLNPSKQEEQERYASAYT